MANPKSLDSVVEQLAKILQSPELQDFLGINAKKTVESKYDLQENFRRIHELILR